MHQHLTSTLRTRACSLTTDNKQLEYDKLRGDYDGAMCINMCLSAVRRFDFVRWRGVLLFSVYDDDNNAGC